MTQQSHNSAPESRAEALHRMATSLASRPAGLWVILVLVSLFVLTGHHSLGVMDRDEARFAQASKQMLASGDFITPYFMDEIRAKKPILIYWLQSASAAFFGADNIASYRLPSLIGLLTTLFLSYHFVRSLWDTAASRAQGFIAAALLASSPLVIAEAHLAKTDSILLSAICLQQFMLWRIYRNRHHRNPTSHWFGFWTALSLGILIKGPIAPAVAGLTILCLVILDRQLSWLKTLYAGRGLLWMSILVLPWAIAVSIATDGAFLDIAINADFLAKVSSVQESHGAPFGTYLVLLPVLFWPALTFAGFLFWLGRALWQEDALRFCLAWCAGYWLMIELTPTKLPHYILPVLPALAMMMSHALIRSLPAPSWRVRLTTDLFYLLSALSALALCVLLFWASVKYSGAAGGRALIYSLLAGLIAVGMIFMLYRWRQLRRFGDFVLLLGLGLCFNGLAVGGITSSLSHIHISERLSQTVSALTPTPPAIVMSGYHEPSAIFHMGRDILLVSPDEAGLFMAEAADGLAIVEKRGQKTFLETAAMQGVTTTLIASLDGINISKGQEITLLLYRPAAKISTEAER